MLTLKVPAMMCGGCSSAMTRIIQRQDPSAQVSAEISEKLLTINSTLPQDALVQLLSDGGYGEQLEVISHE